MEQGSTQCEPETLSPLHDNKPCLACRQIGKFFRVVLFGGLSPSGSVMPPPACQFVVVEVIMSQGEPFEGRPPLGVKAIHGFQK